jgi:hypothetical protein
VHFIAAWNQEGKKIREGENYLAWYISLRFTSATRAGAAVAQTSLMPLKRAPINPASISYLLATRTPLNVFITLFDGCPARCFGIDDSGTVLRYFGKRNALFLIDFEIDFTECVFPNQRPPLAFGRSWTFP